MPTATTRYERTVTTTTTTTTQKRIPSYNETPVPAVRTRHVMSTGTSKDTNRMLDDVKSDDSQNVVMDTLAALVTDCNATAEYLRSRSSSRQNLNDISDDSVRSYHINQVDYSPPRYESKRQSAVTSPTTAVEQPSGDSPVIVEYKLRLHSPYTTTDRSRRRGDTPERRTPSLERAYNEFGLETPRDRSVSRARSETPSSRRMIMLEEPKDKDAPICAFCDQAIYGPCVTALAPNSRKAQKYHPPHFICYYCTRPLNLRGTYKEHERKPYCHDCFYRLFSGHVYEIDSARASSRV